MVSSADLPLEECSGEVFRIISTRYPSISIFERVASPDDFDLLYEIESLTNPRLRDEVGDISLVPRADRVFGPGSSWIMAPFTHPPQPGRGGRFNREFGMFYCADSEHVAIAETRYHSAKFLKESRIDAITSEMRVLRAQVGYQALRDASDLDDDRISHTTDYTAGQALGDQLKAQNEYGIRYRSVRGNGLCIGILRPVAVAAITHSRYLNYHYRDGVVYSVTPAKAV
tara:strand:- start:2297 stop:2980 length:684 start_codon:yes stop_codon:yes gene_type:complete